MMEPKIFIRSRTIFAIVIFIFLVIILFLIMRDDLRTPKSLFEEAQRANPNRSSNLYNLIGKKLPLIQDYARLWSAQAKLPDQEALDDLEAIIVDYPNTYVGYLANLLLARLYIGEDVYKTESAYQAALALNESPALRLEYARFLENQNKFGAAYNQYRRLITDLPDSYEALRRLADDPIQLASNLVEATYFSDALEVLRDVDELSAEPLRAKALVGLERFDEAFSVYQEILEENPDDFSSKMGLAKVLVQSGQSSQATDLFEEIDTNDSRLEIANLLENEDPLRSLELYKESPYPVAWWNATWLLEEDGHLEEAIELYRRVAEAGTYFSDDAAFRLFVLATRLDDPVLEEEGKKLLKSTGRGWLSLRGLGEGYEYPWIATIPVSEESIFDKVKLLDDLGREDLAYKELLFGAKNSKNPYLKLRYLEDLSERGYTMDAFEIAEKFLDEYPELPLNFWRFSYPRPYPETVREVAQEYNVDPFLLWSMIRVESRYNPKVTSLAGARGLMQILPSTQEWIEDKMDLDLQPGDAYNPEFNIKMGGWYLNYLLDYFNNDLELAVLAYNGGFENVNQWLADPMVKNRDDLIRWIWFGESREYLERVMYAYQIYKEIYEEMDTNE